MRVRSKKTRLEQTLTLDQWNAMPIDIKKRFEIIESDQKPTKHPMQFPEPVQTLKTPVKKKLKK